MRNKVTKTKLFDMLVQRATNGMQVTTKDIRECIGILRNEPPQKMQSYCLALYRYLPNAWMTGKRWNVGGWRRPTVRDLRYLEKIGRGQWLIQIGGIVFTKLPHRSLRSQV